ncbi:hypothetical protein LguiA_000589 [Lonicera macranthoides]
MAADVCTEISTLVLVSPRISFSHDLNQSDNVPADCHHRRPDLDPTADFNFSITQSFLQELSSADELFSNGKILPTQIKKQTPTKETHQSHQILTINSDNPNEDSKKKRLKEFLFEEDQETEKPSSKSFWQFRRSSSLNCDNGQSNGFIKSLQILSRSNSTGSALNQKETMMRKDSRKQYLQKQSSFMRSNSSSSTSGSYYYYDSSKRPPLKKNCRAYGSGVRISPVLNIPQGSVNLFGICSLFCNGNAPDIKTLPKNLGAGLTMLQWL